MRRARNAAVLLLLPLVSSCGGTPEEEAVRSAHDEHAAGSSSEPTPAADGAVARASPARPPPPSPRPPPVAPPPPAAPVDPEVEAARALFEEGLRAFEAGDWEPALQEFEAAHRLSPRPQILYNIAVCRERLGDVQGAIGALQRYLGEDPDMSELQRQLVLDKIRELEESLAIER